MRPLAMILLALVCGGCQSQPRRAWNADAVPEAYARSTAALMWPGATRAVQVTPEGDLYDGVRQVRLIAAVDGVAAAPPRVIAFEQRWRPVAHWQRRAKGVVIDAEAGALPWIEGWTLDRNPLARAIGHWAERRAEATVVAAPAADRLVVGASRHYTPDPDDRQGLIVSLAVTVTNGDTRPHAMALDAVLAPPAPGAWRAPDGEGEPIGQWSGRRQCVGVREGLPARRTLAPGEHWTARIVTSVYPGDGRALERWAELPHARRMDEVRDAWTTATNHGMRIALGDPALEDAVRAARVVLLACRERRDGAWMPLGGPFHYRDVWLRDGARTIAALAVHGYARESQELALGLLSFQYPHGPFVSQAAQLDGTGQAVWALEQALLRPYPAPAVPRAAQAATRAWQWCERMRRADGGLLPPADPHDNELVRAQLVGTDAWALAGYRATTRLLAAAHEDLAARAVRASAEDYHRRMVAALAASGRADLPAAWDGRGIDWGNLAAAWPCGAFPADDPHVRALARRYWSAAGGPGLGYYQDPDVRHGYVAADLATDALLAGRGDEARAVLDSLLAWRSASGGAAEMFSRRTRDFGDNLPPHATAAAALLALSRNALIMDEPDDRLTLTAGARAAWWQHGGHVIGAPTWWGMVNLSFARTHDVATWRWTPVPVMTALVLPPHTHVRGRLPAPLHAGPRADVVLAPAGVGVARLSIAAD